MVDDSDNVIAVGSVSELADILANMTPDQLQNVTLDPTLYDALSKTIAPQGNENGLVTDTRGQVDIAHTVLPPESEAASNVSINKTMLENNTITSINPNNLTMQPVEPAVISITNNLINNNPLPTHNLISNLQPQSINQTINLPSLSNNQAIEFINPSQTNLIQQNINYVSVPQDTIINPQPYNLLSNPNVVDLSSILNTQSGFQVISTPTISLQPGSQSIQGILSGSQSIQGILTGSQSMQGILSGNQSMQGILPGESSSLIITPTVMSQVQPTASIQSLRISNGNIIQNSTPPTMQPVLNPLNIVSDFNSVPLDTNFQPLQANLVTQPNFSTVTLDSQVVFNGNTVIGNVMPTEISLQQLLDAGVITANQIPGLLNNKNKVVEKTINVSSVVQPKSKSKLQSSNPAIVKVTKINTPITETKSYVQVTVGNAITKSAANVVRINLPDVCIQKDNSKASNIKVVKNIGVITILKNEQYLSNLKV